LFSDNDNGDDETSHRWAESSEEHDTSEPSVSSTRALMNPNSPLERGWNERKEVESKVEEALIAVVVVDVVAVVVTEICC